MLRWVIEVEKIVAQPEKVEIGIFGYVVMYEALHGKCLCMY